MNSKYKTQASCSGNESPNVCLNETEESNTNVVSNQLNAPYVISEGDRITENGYDLDEFNLKTEYYTDLDTALANYEDRCKRLNDGLEKDKDYPFWGETISSNPWETKLCLTNRHYRDLPVHKIIFDSAESFLYDRIRDWVYYTIAKQVLLQVDQKEITVSIELLSEKNSFSKEFLEYFSKGTDCSIVGWAKDYVQHNDDDLAITFFMHLKSYMGNVCFDYTKSRKCIYQIPVELIDTDCVNERVTLKYRLT